MPTAPAENTPRDCTIADALEVVGDRWSLLIVRELFYAERRFTELARNTGAPRDILTTRLRKLADHGVIVREQYSQRPPRYEYRLTDWAGRCHRCCSPSSGGATSTSEGPKTPYGSTTPADTNSSPRCTAQHAETHSNRDS